MMYLQHAVFKAVSIQILLTYFHPMVKRVISYFYYITEPEVLRRIIFRAERKKQIFMLNS